MTWQPSPRTDASYTSAFSEVKDFLDEQSGRWSFRRYFQSDRIRQAHDHCEDRLSKVLNMFCVRPQPVPTRASESVASHAAHISIPELGPKPRNLEAFR